MLYYYIDPSASARGLINCYCCLDKNLCSAEYILLHMRLFFEELVVVLVVCYALLKVELIYNVDVDVDVDENLNKS